MGLVSGATKRICVVLELYTALTAVLHTHIYSIQNSVHTYACKHAKVLQPCPTLCDPMICSLSGSSVHGNSPDKNTGVGCHALLQGIILTQGLTPHLPHCRPILYHLSHQGCIWVIHKTGKICISTIYCIPVSVSLFHNTILYSFAKIVPLGKLGKGYKVSLIFLTTMCNYTINSMKKNFF